MNEKTEQLKDFLRGMKQAKRVELARLSAYADWHGAARRELERRAEQLLETLPDDILAGLVSGEIQMRETIADVLAEQS
ncbi:hypothetical protein ABU614_01100 [Lysobacter firmicutimachus]|uniref:Uncharacterized protein n=1 Tax=Lysobacter firmicutimachus TaxID=1792846 RepID=A0AAU8MS99_9GAMM